jgi:hypothetical protein
MSPLALGSILFQPVRVKVTLPGAYNQPDKGLLVLPGSILDFRCTDFTDFPIPANQMVWQVCRRMMDGSWTEWSPVSTGNTQGSYFSASFSQAGIYKVQVWMITADYPVNVQKTFGFARRVSEVEGNLVYGPGKAGFTDCVGVAQSLKEYAFLLEARNFLASTAYDPEFTLPAQYGFPAYPNEGASTDRCNIFVAHRGVAAGLNIPKINGYFFEYPPIANQWSGVSDSKWWTPVFDSDIDDWNLWQNIELFTMKPGMIIATPNQGGIGHCAIVDYDGEGIGAGSSGTVNKNYPFFIEEGGPRFRSYTGP